MFDPIATLQVGAIVLSVVGAGVYVYALKTSGRARPHDEVAVRALLDTAPYHRLDNIRTSDRG